MKATEITIAEKTLESPLLLNDLLNGGFKPTKQEQREIEDLQRDELDNEDREYYGLD